MEENNEIYKKQDKKCLTIVIIISILVIGVSVVGILFLNNKKENNNTNTGQTNTTNTNIIDNTSEDEDTPDETKKAETLDKGSLESKITDWNSNFADEKTITVNDKEHKIAFTYVRDSEGVGLEYIKFDGKIICEADEGHSFNEIYYYVVNGEDNIQYILIKYYIDDEAGVIIDDSGKILKEITNNTIEIDCRAEFAHNENDRLNNPMIYIDNGYIYYYKYMNGNWSSDEGTATLEQIKVTISGGNVSEIKTNNQKTAKLFNCQ